MDMQGGGFGAGDLTAAQHVRLAGGGVAAPVAPVANHHRHELMIGEVVDLSGSASRILLDSAEIGKLESSNDRSEEHTSELQSLMRMSYAVYCWTTTTKNKQESH